MDEFISLYFQRLLSPFQRQGCGGVSQWQVAKSWLEQQVGQGQGQEQEQELNRGFGRNVQCLCYRFGKHGGSKSWMGFIERWGIFHIGSASLEYTGGQPFLSVCLTKKVRYICPQPTFVTVAMVVDFSWSFSWSWLLFQSAIVAFGK